MRINYIAIALGFVATLTLMSLQYWFYVEAPIEAVREPVRPMWLKYGAPIYIAIQAILPGVIAGYIAKENGLFHAGIAAVLGALVVPIIYSDFTGGYWNGVFVYVFDIGVFITISGLLGEKLSKKRVAL